MEPKEQRKVDLSSSMRVGAADQARMMTAQHPGGRDRIRTQRIADSSGIGGIEGII